MIRDELIESFDQRTSLECGPTHSDALEDAGSKRINRNAISKCSFKRPTWRLAYQTISYAITSDYRSICGIANIEMMGFLAG